MAILVAMTADLEEGSPAGKLYGESLANTLAVYLLRRYSARGHEPPVCRGGLSGYRLKHVLEHIDGHLVDDLSLADLAAVAGMSAHHFSECSGISTGRAPHGYVLLQRIEWAKRCLRRPQGQRHLRRTRCRLPTIRATSPACFGNSSG